MLDAHTTSPVRRPITFSSPEEADEILESYHETLADYGSSAFFGGASAGDAAQIARMMMGDDFVATADAARAYLASIAPVPAAIAPVAVHPDDILFRR